MAKYVHDDLNNRIESMSKEEIYALIDAVIESGELPTELQEAFVTAFKSIVDGKAYKMAFCTQAEYNELEAQGELVADALYIITDDSSYDDLVELINNAITGFQATIDALPRTSELMQEEASDNQGTIDLNQMTDLNNYIEVMGYIYNNNTATRHYYFTLRLKASDVDGTLTNEGRAAIPLQDDIIYAKCLANYRINPQYTQYFHLTTSLSRYGSSSGASDFSFKILSVKELINY